MSPDPAAAGAPWPVLSLVERRVLGVLVEKAKTTPDAYPLSLNALVTGCNQKSNRDPIMDVSEDDAEETLTALQAKGLTTKITGGRVVRWRHNLYDVWDVEKVELAILAELLLRGPQTEGELRSRAGRMEPLDDLEALRAALRPLAERKLVLFLGPEGRRGTLITHGFHDAREVEALQRQGRIEEAARAAAPAAPVSSAGAGFARAEDVEGLREEVAAIRTQLRQAQEALQELRGQLQALKESLGA
jgi:uncharacterized protein YceH (UPF0502 family)